MNRPANRTKITTAVTTAGTMMAGDWRRTPTTKTATSAARATNSPTRAR